MLRESEICLEFADLNRMMPKQRVSEAPRSSGVHLSGVIKYILTAAKQLEPDEYSEMMPLRMAVGMAWEAFIVQLWPDLVWQPGEICRDNIYGSPDGVTGDCLEEVKATWMSRLDRGAYGETPPPKRITDHKRWMLQVGGYLYMMGLTKVRMHVLWVNGDYRGSGPQYFTYLIEFTQAELERIWNNMILPNVDGAVAEVYG